MIDPQLAVTADTLKKALSGIGGDWTAHVSVTLQYSVSFNWRFEQLSLTMAILSVFAPLKDTLCSVTAS